MSDSDIIVSITPLISIFDNLRIPYFIGGSVASSAYGKARSTLDVDIVAPITMPNANRLAEALKNIYYVSEDDIKAAILRSASFNIIHLETMLKIDVFVLKKREYDQQAFERKIEDHLDEEEQNRSFFLASPEDVIINKLEWYKAGDGISERQWNDVVGVMMVQGDRLDKQYLLSWAEKLGLSDLLEKALKEASQ
jgi:hypothetical protein